MAALDAWVSGTTRGVRRWGTIGQTLTARRAHVCGQTLPAGVTDRGFVCLSTACRALLGQSAP